MTNQNVKLLKQEFFDKLANISNLKELENLELICPNCHGEEHYLENSWLSGTVSD